MNQHPNPRRSQISKVWAIENRTLFSKRIHPFQDSFDHPLRVFLCNLNLLIGECYHFQQCQRYHFHYTQGAVKVIYYTFPAEQTTQTNDETDVDVRKTRITHLNRFGHRKTTESFPPSLLFIQGTADEVSYTAFVALAFCPWNFSLPLHYLNRIVAQISKVFKSKIREFFFFLMIQYIYIYILLT